MTDDDEVDPSVGEEFDGSDDPEPEPVSAEPGDDPANSGDEPYEPDREFPYETVGEP